MFSSDALRKIRSIIRYCKSYPLSVYAAREGTADESTMKGRERPSMQVDADTDSVGRIERNLMFVHHVLYK